MKKTYVLLRLRKKANAAILKGKYPNGWLAIFKSEAAARKIQKRFKTFGVYLLTKV